MVSKVVKLATMNQEERKESLKKKLEIMRIKMKLIQEELDNLELDQFIKSNYPKETEAVSK